MRSRLSLLLLAPALFLLGCDGAQKHDAPATSASAAPPSAAVSASASASGSASLPALGLPQTVVVRDDARLVKGDYFGSRKIGDEVGAAVAVSGNLLVVGAPWREREDGGLGAALVFRKSGATYTLAGELREKGQRLGRAVATDGQAIFVDARPDAGDEEAGAVLVFEQRDGAWVKTQRLLPDDGKKGDRFGGAIAVENGTLVIGAEGNAGAVFAFERSGAEWKQVQKLAAAAARPGSPTLSRSNGFGATLALEGGTLVVAQEYASGAMPHSGFLHVYGRDGDQWVEKATLASQDPIEGEALGSAVAVSGDTIAALANLPEHRSGVVLFGRSGGTWSQREVIVEPMDAKLFSASLALRGDMLCVGAQASHKGRGAVLLYKLEGSDSRLLRTLSLEPESGDAWFGSSVAFAGSTLVAGARLLGDRAGAVYLLTP